MTDGLNKGVCSHTDDGYDMLVSAFYSGVTYIFHLFVYGFGTFTGFVMVDCMSRDPPSQRSLTSCSGLEWYAVLDALTTFCVEVGHSMFLPIPSVESILRHSIYSVHTS